MVKAGELCEECGTDNTAVYVGASVAALLFVSLLLELLCPKCAASSKLVSNLVLGDGAGVAEAVGNEASSAGRRCCGKRFRLAEGWWHRATVKAKITFAFMQVRACAQPVRLFLPSDHNIVAPRREPRGRSHNLRQPHTAIATSMTRPVQASEPAS